MQFKSTSDTYWWVVSLLAAAVILPTVSLLWFMTTAVRNERLAMRQKLVEVYSSQANDFFVKKPDACFSGLADYLNRQGLTEPGHFIRLFSVNSQHPFQGMLLYDAAGRLQYPVVAFQMNQPDQKPADRNVQTIESAYQIAYPDHPQTLDSARAVETLRYRVFLAEQLMKNRDDRLLGHLRKALGDDTFCDNGPAETIVWQLEKLIALAAEAGMAGSLEPEIQAAHHRIAAYTRAVEAALLHPTLEGLDGWPDRTVRRLAPDKDLYGFRLNIQNQTVIAISTRDRLLNVLAKAAEEMQDDTIHIQVADHFGQVIFGTPGNTEKPFLTLSAGSFLPDFTVSVYFKSASVFESAAGRQRLIYIWSSVLVIILMLVFTSLAAREVLRQARLNKIKNNFVATVTHELKTPLSSMRLLVDTLLDGSYTDAQQCKEYLDLISHENLRLSRMIDSFLTFSRMERNKQVFDFQSVDPAGIVHAAAQAVQTKMNQAGCHFTVSTDHDLPRIRADKDGLTTVLVNLLDNAYKYSYPDKTIELKAYRENGTVCFAVHDNGIGIPRRIQKKIFNRFFQADSRLSRSVEGCGMGLSIVKFIVNAHKGTIDVESKVGSGSRFTVRIPHEKRRNGAGSAAFDSEEHNTNTEGGGCREEPGRS